ncbi:translation initiation factor eIF-2A, partial [Jaminaea rosea]
MASTSQWAYRSQKSIGLMTGPPSFAPVSGFDREEADSSNPTRVFKYSPDGRWCAMAMEKHFLLLSTADPTSSVRAHTIEVPRVVDIAFSPRGGYVSTWQRPFKDAEGNNVANLKLWRTSDGAEVGAWERKSQEGCHPQINEEETHLVRQVSTELQIFEPDAIKDKGVVGRLRLEGMTSYELGAGSKPVVAVFCGEKKGAPASVRVYPLASLIPSPPEPPAPISQKTFFKADKIQMKWNRAGTSLLFMTSTDVDRTNKSYYGETNLYMMSARGDFDCRVSLDKEGPIHDFEWSTNGREFIVIYGYMPAKATLFSFRVNVIAELGTAARNTVAFNPQGRLFCLAGFGNLSGSVDVWDRQQLSKGKLFTFDASNSSVLEWSPCGEYLLCATLSPRLRVENGVKIWHCTGNLIHVDMIDELYQAGWRPGFKMATDAGAREPPAFPDALPSPPAPSPTAKEWLDKVAAKPQRPTGAYRPPGARGAAASDAYKRDEDGKIMMSSSSSPARTVPGSNGHSAAARGAGGRRQVPGASSSSSRGNSQPGTPAPGTPTGPKGGKKGAAQAAKRSGTSTPTPNDQAAPASAIQSEQPSAPVASGAAEVGGSAEAGALDKRLRNLTKKLKAIEELKARRNAGEKLEQTQVLKIANEAELRKELADL